MSDRRLYKSRYDKKVAGVCGGIAEFFGIDSTIVRIATLILIIPLGMSLWVYILAALIMPDAP